MKQIEASKERPFYSVGYCYKNFPWTCYSFTQWWEFLPDPERWTMQGTDNKELALAAAKWLLTQAGISQSFVHVSTDCYNHPEVAKFSLSPIREPQLANQNAL